MWQSPTRTHSKPCTFARSFLETWQLPGPISFKRLMSFLGEFVGATVGPDRSSEPVGDQWWIPQVEPYRDAQQCPLPKLGGDRNQCQNCEDSHSVPSVPE